MSPNRSAQDRREGAQLPSSDASPPGRRLLDAAIVIYLIALAVFVSLAALGVHTEASKHSATMLLIVPAAFLGMIFVLYYSVFFVSSLAGVPLIRFSNGLSPVQRNFRGIVGTVLLLAVLCAILGLTT